MFDRPAAITGVYVAVCTMTGEMYVGSSLDMHRRWRRHRNRLRKGTHTSAKMQARWDEHPSMFSFAILRVCRADELLDIEQYFLDRLKPELNTALTASSSRGVKLTYEQRQKLKLRPQSQASRRMVQGQMQSVTEMAERYGLQAGTIRARLRRGVQGDALAAPLQRLRSTSAAG